MTRVRGPLRDWRPRERRDCHHCRGTGKIVIRQNVADGGILVRDRCPYCFGAGKRPAVGGAPSPASAR